MLDQLQNFFGRGADAAEPNALAVAAILIEAARADDKYTGEEKRLIDLALERGLGVTKSECARIRSAAEGLQTDAADLFMFTKKVKALPEIQRIAVVEALWRVVLSDSARGQYENSLVRHVAGLLEVKEADSDLARQRVEKER